MDSNQPKTSNQLSPITPLGQAGSKPSRPYSFSETRMKIRQGVNLLADTVKLTLGTKGRLVMYLRPRDYEDPFGEPVMTKDGVTVAKQIESDDPVTRMAIHVVREAANNTVKSSGDGPQPLYSKVLTPSGFVEMGSLKVGDKICGSHGTIQTVEEVHPKGKKEIYEVVFSDGRIVECCEDHLWTITTYYGSTKTVPLRRIIEEGTYLVKPGSEQKQYRFYTPKSSVEFDRVKVPIHPYFLGVLLGDGSLSGKGDIELSLGPDKKHIIYNIPKDVSFTSEFVEEKNYFRVKIKSDKLKKSLQELGLYGTTSSTKFIPKDYLYNDLIARECLLQGLLDTDGYINKKGLFEYSTVSDRLAEDFLELSRSLGFSTNHRVHSKESDTGSHSNTPIHRIQQLKGYKYGDKIVEVRATGKTTEMQCIKVSNLDSLYITDNYIFTHNTTSTTILAQEIINRGYDLLDQGVASYELNRDADMAVEDIVTYIEENSSSVTDDNNILKQVATISSNSEKVGSLIHDIIEELGPHAEIEIKETKNSTTEIELVKGMKLHKGYYASFFCNDPDREEWRAQDVNVLIFDGIIRDYVDIADYVQASVDPEGNPRPLLIYAEDVALTAMDRIQGLMKYNPRPIMIVEHDGFGDRRIELMNDLSIITGGIIVDEASRISPTTALGFCEEVIVNNRFSSFLGGNSDEEDKQKEIQNIQRKLEVANLSGNEEKYYRKRLSNLMSGIAVIHVGGSTKVEMKEESARIEDAVLAVKSAIKAGVSVGGAFTWERASRFARNRRKKIDPSFDEKVHPTYTMVMDSLRSILNQLLTNSEETHKLDDIRKNVFSKKPKAYNLIDRQYYLIEDYEVYDPSSVLIDSIKNATAVSKSILAVERAIVRGNVTI